jgi:DNA-binding PadR family transcriptional regulator
MSRGPGRVQRHILDVLTTWGERQGSEGWRAIHADEVMDIGEWEPPRRAEQSSIQRALRTLEARGLIEVKLRPRRPGIGGPIPAQLVARLPLSVAPTQFKDNT